MNQKQFLASCKSRSGVVSATIRHRLSGVYLTIKMDDSVGSYDFLQNFRIWINTHWDSHTYMTSGGSRSGTFRLPGFE